MNTNTDAQVHLPLRESTYFILLSLASEPRHGYGIMKAVRSISQNHVTLSSGTLYGALKRLLDQGWIVRLDLVEPNNTTRERKFYQLTNLGRSVLDAEVARLNGLIAAAQNQLVGGNAAGANAPA